MADDRAVNPENTKALHLEGYVRLLVRACIFLMPGLALALPSGYSYGAAGLVILGAWELCARGTLKLSAVERVLIGLSVCFFLLWGWDGFVRGDGLRELDRPSKVLFAVLTIWAVRWARPSPSFFWVGAVVGAVLAGTMAVWDTFIIEQARASGFAQTNQFGKISGALGLLSAVAMLRSHSKFKITWGLLCSAGLAMGLLGCLLSGSRGAWVGVLFASPLILLALLDHRPGKRVLLALLITGVIGSVGIATLAGDTINNRVGAAFKDLEDYRNGDLKSSIGHRLELWRNGLQMVPGAWLIGRGESGLASRMETLVNEGKVDGALLQFTHLHNEPLDTLVKRGALGLIIYSGLILGPIGGFFYYRRKMHVKSEKYNIALAAAILSLSFFIFGLFQSNFEHNSGVVFYFFMLNIIASLFIIELNREN